MSASRRTSASATESTGHITTQLPTVRSATNRPPGKIPAAAPRSIGTGMPTAKDCGLTFAIHILSIGWVSDGQGIAATCGNDLAGVVLMIHGSFGEQPLQESEGAACYRKIY